MIVGYFFTNTSFSGEFDRLVELSSTAQQKQLENISSAKDGNTLAKYGSFSIFLPTVLFAPFPSFVHTNQKNIMMLGGMYYVKNILMYFFVIGFIGLYRRKLLKKYSILFIYIFSYLIVISLSSFVLSERFHFILLPFYTIVCAYGINYYKDFSFNYFIVYLSILFVILLGWNWFKLAGRGLI